MDNNNNNEINTEIVLTDPRAGYLLCNRPELFMAIMLVYLVFVTIIGPKLMTNRQPFQLFQTLVVYNGLLVVINGYYSWLSLQWLEFGQKSLNSYIPPAATGIVWTNHTVRVFDWKMLYFYTKLVDLLDTVFFVLRKKSSQITFLHVYHHIVVSLLIWASVAWCPQTVILETTISTVSDISRLQWTTSCNQWLLLLAITAMA
ncbi:elongation of very long chain fatty acids protein 7-like [Oppia nitens]|uniref:elongation of very long chain fatty acids protein 7-like n=1 Tax=Oppia nitens TaxID=1686743 RepID=UPI0023DC8BBB|nr:elongation of very long chain fatty acids protein 7-like [Oppia nitens]